MSVLGDLATVASKVAAGLVREGFLSHGDQQRAAQSILETLKETPPDPGTGDYMKNRKKVLGGKSDD